MSPGLSSERWIAQQVEQHAPPEEEREPLTREYVAKMSRYEYLARQDEVDAFAANGYRNPGEGDS